MAGAPLIFDSKVRILVYTPDLSELLQYLRNVGGLVLTMTNTSSSTGCGLYRAEVPLAGCKPQACVICDRSQWQ